MKTEESLQKLSVHFEFVPTQALREREREHPYVQKKVLFIRGKLSGLITLKSEEMPGFSGSDQYLVIPLQPLIGYSEHS